MSYKGHIVKDPTKTEEKQKYKKGCINREPLKFIKLKKHPLKKIQSKISLATHHIISVRATESLNLIRRNLLKCKSYNVNHPKNLVTLPTEKTVCCHYALPRHISAHTGKHIIPNSGFNFDKTLTKLENLYKNEKNERSKNEITFETEMDGIANLKGYHKICRLKLSNQIKLKGLNCKSKPEDVVNAIDKLSTQLLHAISTFKLSLFNNGRYYKDNDSGCLHSNTRKCNRNHNYPEFKTSVLYLINKEFLMRVYDMKSTFDIECNAPKVY